MILRDYQITQKNQIEEFINNSRFKKGLVVAPVGTGKSLYPSLISEYVGDKCLVLQPSSELLLQNVEKAENLGLDVNVYSASQGRKEIGNITYATHKSVINHPSLFKEFKYVVIDEAHMHLTNKLKGGKVVDEGRVVDFLNIIKPEKVIGLTATPIQLVSHALDNQLKMLNRSKASYWCFAEMISTLQIKDVFENWWSNIDYKIVPKTMNLLSLNSTKRDYTQESLQQDYDANNFEDKIIEEYEKLKAEGKKKILIFVPNIEQGLRLNKKNRNLISISSKTDADLRKQLIHDFKYGELDCLVNTELLTTGFDCPELDGIILARETNSFVLYYQIVGRLVRLLRDGSKTNGKFVDLTDTYNKFGNVTGISFENNDYTKGWAMWNNDKLMTNVYLNSGESVSRDEQKESYKKQLEMKDQDKPVKVGERQFHFGKYKYKQVKTVCQKDIRYVEWLLNNKDFKWQGEKMLLLREDLQNTVEELRLM